MSDDLIERLRIFAKFDPDQAEAADEIERLREHISKQQLDIITLGQEVGRLREALRRVRTAIVEADPSILTCTLWMPDTMSETVVDHIDAALGEEKKS